MASVLIGCASDPAVQHRVWMQLTAAVELTDSGVLPRATDARSRMLHRLGRGGGLF